MQIRFVFCNRSVDDMSPVKIEVTDVTAADSNKDKEEGLWFHSFPFIFRLPINLEIYQAEWISHKTNFNVTEMLCLYVC